MHYKIQPAAFTDQLTSDGAQLAKKPYPIVCDQRGNVLESPLISKVIGFVADLSRQEVDLHWRERTLADDVVGMYLIVADHGGAWSTLSTAIESFTVLPDPPTRAGGLGDWVDETLRRAGHPSAEELATIAAIDFSVVKVDAGRDYTPPPLKSSTSCRRCRRWLEGDWNAATPEARPEIQRQMDAGRCDVCTAKEARQRGVHATHCCILHGCKYGSPDCPVVLNRVGQEYPCEQCPEEPVSDADADELLHAIREAVSALEGPLTALKKAAPGLATTLAAMRRSMDELDRKMTYGQPLPGDWSARRS